MKKNVLIFDSMTAPLRFVPSFKQVTNKDIRNFANQLADVDRILVITGAGISTESGVPDYRSKDVGLYERSNYRPMMHNEFMKSEKNRQRYWARNFLAWPAFSKAPCNVSHTTLAKWERSDRFTWLITQNVDALHSKAGSSMLTELHGCAHRVKCTECGEAIEREYYQSQLRILNPSWSGASAPGEMRPDGDVHLEEGAEEGFSVPPCRSCEGVMKPDVVFFGDNVPRPVVDNCYQKVDESNALLVLGSSLSVMSSYRFVYHAHLQKKPIFIVNIGPTRGDKYATAKIETKVSDALTAI